ncbi:MAG TPA: amidohydrolase family protein [Vicinamibacteria bacterium]|jgi:imidazolonepropionase-like amidohydrolase
MTCHRQDSIALTLWLAIGLISCREALAPGLPTEDAGEIQAFLGARIIDGSGREPIENGVLVVREGRIAAVGPSESTAVPEGAQRIDVSGRTIVPGFVVTHGHVGQTKGLESGPENYTEENVLSQLALYARYGVTTVVSLGSDANPALGVRDGQHTKDLRRARLYIAGEQLSGQTAEEAVAAVDEMADRGVDFIKIRVDDNLGTTEKSSPEFYGAAIRRAHERGLKTAAHLFYLEDAKGLLNADIDLLAHSVRDQEVDEELIALIKEKNVCQTPTLVREMVSFVYEDVPDFFADPFFLEEVDSSVVEQLKDPERQRQVRESASAQAYKKALDVAMTNLKKLADAGATISFGTDSGPPARFQGYFEHLEMEYMAETGLTPMQILVAATGNSARCVGLDEDFGTLESGKWADFVVLRENPLVDIENTRSIESVWIAGNEVPRPHRVGRRADRVAIRGSLRREPRRGSRGGRRR